MMKKLRIKSLALLLFFVAGFSFSAYTQSITITGTSAGNDIICLADNPQFDILVDLDGTFPDDVVFTAYADHIAPVEIGTATGNGITSITVTDFDHSYSGSFQLFIQSDNGITSNFFTIDIIHEIDPALDYLLSPSAETVTIEPGDPVEVGIYNNTGIGLFYKVIHLGTETSVTDWAAVPDDPAVVVIENAAEGTYRLIARGQGHVSGIICEDSVPLNEELNTFTVIHETVTGALTSKNPELHVYPNPASDLLTVQFPESNRENILLQVTDLSGSVILTETSVKTSGTVKIYLTELTGGIYLIKMLSDEGVSVSPFIKN